MSKYRKARVVAFQILYSDELNAGQVFPVEMVRERVGGDAELMAYAEKLVLGVHQHQSVIDEEIQAALENWRLNRLTPTDRNILRMGVFEFQFFNVPPGAAINEAIEIAKEFGEQNSGSFVNGVLDKIRKNLQK